MFNSLKWYDSHLITKAYKGRNIISVLTNTDENFMVITVAGFRFIDSCSFLDGHLAELGAGLERVICPT